MALNLGTLFAKVRVDGTDKAQRDLKSLATGVKNLAAGWLSLEAATKAFDLAKQGAAAKDAIRAFEAGGKSIEKFRKATNGMISDAELAKKFNLAESLGVTEGAFLSLAKVAQASAARTGQSVSYLFESAIVGAARQSPMILDNLGISIKKTGDKAAFMAELLAKGNEIVAKAGDVANTSAAKYERFSAAIQNLTDKAGGLMDNFVTNTVADLVRLWDEWEEGFTTAWNVVKSLGVAIIKFADGVISVVVRIVTTPIKIIRKQIGWLKQSLGGLLKGIGNSPLVGSKSLRGFGAGLVAAGKFEVKDADALEANTLANYSLENALKTFLAQFEDAAPRMGGQAGEAHTKALKKGWADAGESLISKAIRKGLAEARLKKAYAGDIPSWAHFFTEGTGLERGNNSIPSSLDFFGAGARPTFQRQNGLVSLFKQGMSAFKDFFQPQQILSAITKVADILVDLGVQFVAAIGDLAKAFASDVFGAAASKAQNTVGRGVQSMGVFGGLGAAAAFTAFFGPPILFMLSAAAGPLMAIISTLAAALALLATFLAPVIAGFAAMASAGFFIGFGMSQISNTNSGSKLSDRLSTALDRAAAPLNGFAIGLHSLIPLIEMTVTAFNLVSATLLNDAAPMLFNVFHVLAQSAVGLARAYQESLFIFGMGDQNKLDQIIEIQNNLASLDYGSSLQQAVAGTDALATSSSAAADQLDRLTRNLPEGYKVLNAVYNAQDGVATGPNMFDSPSTVGRYDWAGAN